MTRLEWMIINLRPVKYLINRSKDVSLPGPDKLTLYEVGKFFFRELRNSKLNVRAAAVTYNFLMAMPPTFLFLFSLVPYLPLKNVEQAILSVVRMLTPNEHIYGSVSGIIVDFMTTQRRDILSFGIILTLFFSSNGMMGLMRSFDHSLSLYKKRTGLARRWTAIKLTILLICVVIVSLAVLVIQSQELNGFMLKIFHTVLAVKLLSMVILVLIVFFAISLIYTYGPSLSYRFKFVSAGSIFATLLSMIATAAFFFLVNNFINYNKVYGSIGTLIAFMVWVWLNTLVILIGYELNVGILLGKLSHTKRVEKEAVKK